MKDFHDINWLYTKYYGDNPELLKTVYTHSRMVAKKALDIAEKKILNIDRAEIFCAAMLHDIGVVKCNAPDINAYGNLPYLLHGIEGKKILEEHGLFKLAKICERHTGVGITAKEIKDRKLPLPPVDMIPRSKLEKLICYADKFYSKSGDLEREKSFQEIEKQMERFGKGSLKRFKELHLLFNT